jgi:hypothetical protein
MNARHGMGSSVTCETNSIKFLTTCKLTMVTIRKVTLRAPKSLKIRGSFGEMCNAAKLLCYECGTKPKIDIPILDNLPNWELALEYQMRA